MNTKNYDYGSMINTVRGGSRRGAISGSNPKNKQGAGAARTLAEAIIFQGIEDLWCEEEKSRSISFFRGEDFQICAKMAGMDFDEQVNVLNLVKNISNSIKGKRQISRVRKEQKPNYSERAVLV